MGAFGTGFSQGYHKQVGQASPYPTPGGAPGVPPPYAPAPTKGGGGGGLKEMMGTLGGGEPPTGLEGVAQFAAPSPSMAAGDGLKAAMGGAGGAAGGGAPSIQSTLTPNMPGGGPAKGASGMFNLMKLFVR